MLQLDKTTKRYVFTLPDCHNKLNQCTPFFTQTANWPSRTKNNPTSNTTTPNSPASPPATPTPPATAPKTPSPSSSAATTANPSTDPANTANTITPNNLSYSNICNGSQN